MFEITVFIYNENTISSKYKKKPNINNSFRKNGFKNYIGKCE